MSDVKITRKNWFEEMHFVDIEEKDETTTEIRQLYVGSTPGIFYYRTSEHELCCLDTIHISSWGTVNKRVPANKVPFPLQPTEDVVQIKRKYLM